MGPVCVSGLIRVLKALVFSWSRFFVFDFGMFVLSRISQRSQIVLVEFRHLHLIMLFLSLVRAVFIIELKTKQIVCSDSVS